MKTTLAKKKHAAFDMAQVATGIHIFCDGACEPNPGAGGWGFVVYINDEEIGALSGGRAETTNNQMELTGMLAAIDWVNCNAAMVYLAGAGSATIWCDSAYVVNGCNDWRHKWKAKGWKRKGDKSEKSTEIANLEIWQQIDEGLSEHQVKELNIKWVKGHNGTLGNERADELSNIGRKGALGFTGSLKTLETVAEDLDERYREIMGAV